ncbi:MAG TPA: hypothetical protein VGH53_08020, partial [Streptosporangiaceae bacterium]
MRLPVDRDAWWFGPQARSFVLWIEVPLTCEEMVAALYDVAQPDEISRDEDSRGNAAVTHLIEAMR